jgi:hypothetical protein
MDSRKTLQPYARALAQGRFVVKVYTDQETEAIAACRILETAGGKVIDVLPHESEGA